jgi:sugar/nucleoside kinase (ribokinase family)
MGASTSYTDVMTVKTTGKRTFFHHHGANALLDVRDFDFTKTQATHFHLGYLMLLQKLDKSEKAAKVLAAAREAGLTTSVDVVSGHSDRFAKVVQSVLPHVDIQFLNEYELSQVAGPVPEDATCPALRKATDWLFDQGLRTTVVVHSARFAYARSPQEEQYRLAPIPAQIVGTVGAGDALAAGFLLGFHEKRNLETCLRWGVAAAASCLQGEGASNGVTGLEEALNLIAG